MRAPDDTADDLIDGLVERLAALDDCLHGVAPGTTKLSAAPHAGLDDPHLGDAVDAILMLRQAAAASRRPRSDDDSPLPQHIGRFEIVRLAGSGGFARVAEAIDPTLNRRVALKLPRAEAILTSGLRRRFLREAEIAARLSHPQIVTIHEVGEVDGLAYIAQELCTGGSLAEWLELHPGPLPPRVAVRLVLALARAVAYAHDEGVIHRDIKPANVLLVPTHPDEPTVLPPGWTVKLGDFGLGKASTADDDGATQLTQTGARVGTPTWMAPEQVDASIGPVGPWSDIHSLGLLLDRLLTGRCQRGGRTDAETFRQILLDDPPPCDRVQAGVSRDLGAVCLTCLARNPRDRYGSARALAADLERYLDGHPTVARPLSPAARLGRAVLRRPLAAGLAACAVAAVMLAGWAAGERSRERARHAATAADMQRHEAATALRRGFDAFRTGNAGAALGHLDACRQIDAGLAASFAGRWLERRLHGEQTRLLPREGVACSSLHDVCISPDGTLFAAGAADGTLFLGPLDPLPARHGMHVVRQAHDEINGLAFSPDGRTVATVGQDGVLRLWRAADGASLQDVPSAGAPLFGVAFAADGSFIATGGADRKLTVWPFSDGRISTPQPRTVALADSGDAEIEWLCPLADTRLAVALGRDVLMVDVRPGGGRRVLARYDEVVARLAVSPDGRLLAVVGHARSPLVVSVDDGAPVRMLPRHPSWIDGCGFSADGTKLVTAGKDGIARLYDIASGALEQRFVGHVGRIWDAQFDHEGRVLTAGGDGTLRRWDARTPSDLAGLVVVPHAGVRATAVAAETSGHDRHRLLIGYDSVPAGPTLTPSITGKIDRFDRRSGELSPLPLALRASTRDLVVDPDRDLLVTLATTVPVITLTARSATAGPAPVVLGEPDIVGCCGAIAANGLVVIGCKGGRLVAWNPPATWAVVIARFEKDIDCLAIAPSAPGLLAAGSRRQVRLYDVAGLSGDLGSPGARMVRTLPDLPGDVQALAWSPDGTRLVCGMNDGLVMVFDAATAQAVGSLAAHERDLIGVAYLADGRTLVTADNENIRISDAATRTTLDEIRPGWRVFDLCVMEDGSGVAIVGGVHEAAAPEAGPTGRIGLISVAVPDDEGPP